MPVILWVMLSVGAGFLSIGITDNPVFREWLMHMAIVFSILTLACAIHTKPR